MNISIAMSSPFPLVKNGIGNTGAMGATTFSLAASSSQEVNLRVRYASRDQSLVYLWLIVAISPVVIAKYFSETILTFFI